MQSERTCTLTLGLEDSYIVMKMYSIEDDGTKAVTRRRMGREREIRTTARNNTDDRSKNKYY